MADSYLPLLLSLNTIKMAETILDTKNDEAFMLDNLIKLGRTETGHYTVDLINGESQCLVTVSLENKVDWKRALTKLHEQFAHPPHKRLKELIMASARWEEGMEEILGEIEDKCPVLKCQLKSGRSTKPVVAMPRATRLNQLMTLDLKVRHNKGPILYIIDCFTRLTVAEIIPNKRPKTVAEVIIRRWVGSDTFR